MTELSLVSHNMHDVKIDGKRILFHVPTTSLFEIDEVSGSVLDFFKDNGDGPSSHVKQNLSERFSDQDVDETLSEFLAMDILRPKSKIHIDPSPVKVDNFPLSTIILNVNTGCNLSCTYCYKEDLTSPDKGQKMNMATAQKSIDLLFQQGSARDRVNVVFFGGEPLTNFPLIKAVVAYSEQMAKDEGKIIDFTMTTNATLLTKEKVDWLDEHRFGLSVSMDGPKALHDKHRKTVGGKGSYDAVASKVNMLLQRYKSRPVGARVTLTAGVTDVIKIHQHLKNELGFYEVGFAPATSGDISLFNLTAEELEKVFEDFKILGERYVEAALKGENIGFSNMHQMMADLSDGTKKAVPCGAGLGMLAVDKDGDLNLCHRFTGSDMPRFGNVDEGIDADALGSFIETAQDKGSRSCQTCKARNICAGGCYHESYIRFEDPHSPVYHYCDLIRDWIDFGIKAYGRILTHNPAFLNRHIEPRRN